MSKYDYYDQDEKNEKDEQDEQTRVKKKGGLGGRLVALLLGFVMGFIGCIGGIAGVGYYVAKKKTAKEVLTTFKVDYSKYLSEEYATKTVWDMVGSASSALKGLGNGKGTLGQLAAISPIVEEKLNEFITEAEEAYGIALNYDGKMLTTPVKDINKYFRDCLNHTNAGDMFKKFGNGNKVLTALCYGVEGEDYDIDEKGEIQMREGKTQMTVGDFAGDGLKKRMDALPLDAIMNINLNDKTTAALAYGQEHRYEVLTGKDGTKSVQMKQKYYSVTETEGVITVLNDVSEPVECTATKAVGADAYVLTFPDGTKEYLHKQAAKDKENDKDGGEEADEKTDGETQTPLSDNIEEEPINEPNDTYYAFSDKEYKTAIRFPKTTIGQLQDDSASVLNEITLKDGLNVSHNSHSILIAIAFGEEGIDFEFTYDKDGNKTGIKEYGPSRTVGDFKRNSRQMIDDIYLTNIIAPNHDNSIIMYVLYGRRGVHYELVPDEKNPGKNKPDMLQQQVAVYNGKVYNEYGEVIENAKPNQDNTAYSLYQTNGETETAIATYALTPITGKTITVTVTPATDTTPAVEAEAPTFYVWDETGTTKIKYDRTQFKHLTGETKLLTNLTSRLRLSDVLDVKDNKILRHLKDVPISKLTNEVNNLTVGQIFDEDMHFRNVAGEKIKTSKTDPTERVLTGEAYTYTDSETGSTVTVPAGAYITRYGELATEKYEALRPTWKYMVRTDTGDLTDPDTYQDDKGKIYHYGYKVTSAMADMVYNIEHNMQNTSMDEMSEDGVIESGEHLRKRELSADIKQKNPQFASYTHLGELTINELINYVDLYITLKEGE